METHMNFNMFERRPLINSRAPPVKWFKEWVPQDVVATGGKCKLLKWVNEGTLKALKEKKEPEVPEPEPEPATEIIFLCSYEGCGKPFIDASALRKHAHIHGERHHICHYENCGKKFLDSSKLKRHYLIHTGERDFVCPHEGCGKAFSLDFNLRSHMKTHSQENYHICPYPDCGKRYAHEYKLKNHISSHHEKQNNIIEAPKYIQPVEKPQKTPRSAAATYASTSTTDRPYTCPYEGCNKAYIHEYKLNLHLRREHPGHFKEDNTKNVQHNTAAAADHDMNEGSDHDVFGGSNKRSNDKKLRRPKPKIKLPPAKVAQRRGSTTVSPANNVSAMKKQWQVNEEAYEEEEEDSEETEEERDNIMEGWRYAEQDEEDDEETEYED